MQQLYVDLTDLGVNVGINPNPVEVRIQSGPAGKVMSVSCCGVNIRVGLPAPAAQHLAALLTAPASDLPTAKTMILGLRSTGLTQAEIASKIGCAQSSICAWENDDRGTIRGISGNYLMKLIELHASVCGAEKAA